MDGCCYFLVDSGFQQFCTFDGKRIIINQILWLGTRGQRHSLAYTCAEWGAVKPFLLGSHHLFETQPHSLHKPGYTKCTGLIQSGWRELPIGRRLYRGAFQSHAMII